MTLSTDRTKMYFNMVKHQRNEKRMEDLRDELGYNKQEIATLREEVALLKREVDTWKKHVRDLRNNVELSKLIESIHSQ